MTSYKDKYIKYKMKYIKLSGGSLSPIGRNIITNTPPIGGVYTVTGENETQLFATGGVTFEKNLENVTWRFMQARIGLRVNIYNDDNVLISTNTIIGEGEIDGEQVWRLDSGISIYKLNENTDRNWRLVGQA